MTNHQIVIDFILCLLYFCNFLLSIIYYFQTVGATSPCIYFCLAFSQQNGYVLVTVPVVQHTELTSASPMYHVVDIGALAMRPVGLQHRKPDHGS